MKPNDTTPSLFCTRSSTGVSGIAVAYDAITTNSPLRFVVALIAMGLGIVWLWSTTKETGRHLAR